MCSKSTNAEMNKCKYRNTHAVSSFHHTIVETKRKIQFYIFYSSIEIMLQKDVTGCWIQGSGVGDRESELETEAGIPVKTHLWMRRPL